VVGVMDETMHWSVMGKENIPKGRNIIKNGKLRFGVFMVVNNNITQNLWHVVPCRHKCFGRIHCL
jgi:hypothetical protein